MLAKKKNVPVPAISRSRFAKAKPKIAPKPSPSLQKKEDNPEKNDIQEKPQEEIKCDTPIVVNGSDKVDETTVHIEDVSELPNGNNLDASVEKSTDIGPQTSETPSTIKVAKSLESENVTPQERRKALPNHEIVNKNIESPEKSVLSSSSTKVVSGPSDKSSKYPCITRILNSPKKRAQNKEVNERKKKLASYKELPPRNKMSFSDLIYWKPNTSPMKSKEKSSFVFEVKEPVHAENEEEEVEEEEEDESASAVPKLQMGANGEIIIDQASLVVKRKQKPVDMISEAINMDLDNITYSTFRKKVTKQWSSKETIKFYKAIIVVGTDFALMEKIMPNRTRRELKIKFKKEEKINTQLMHKAMYDTESFQNVDFNQLNLDDIDMPELDDDPVLVRNEVKKEKQKQRKRKSRVLSEIATNDVEDGNNQSVPVKKGRGRPKKVQPSGIDDDSDNSSEIDNGNVCSQDSTENIANPSEDFYEIQVNINSLANNEEPQDADDSLQKPAAKKLCSRKTKSEILFDNYFNSSAIVVNEDKPVYASEKAEESPNNFAITPKNEVQNMCVSDNIAINNTEDKVSSKYNNVPETTNHSSELLKKQQSKNCLKNSKVTYKRNRKINVKPSIKVPKNNVPKIPLEENINIELPQPCSPTSVTIINIDDDQLLSDCITDVITTDAPRVMRRNKYKPKIPPVKQETNELRFKPSFVNFTPVEDDAMTANFDFGQ